MNKAIKKTKDWQVKPELITSEAGHSYIELHYPKGDVDVVKVGTKGGFITSIRIENKIS